MLKNKPLLKIILNLVAMLLVALLILAGTMGWIKKYTRHGQYISVPDVYGMFESEAASVLEAKGLKYEISSYKFVKSMVEGGIVEQTPKAGANVKQDRIIYITLNSGNEPMRTIPDLADNSSLRAAESQLRASGFKLAQTIYIDGDRDWVYEIRYQGKKIEAGAEVPEGSTLTIVAGNGKFEEIIQEADSIDLVDDDFFTD